MSDNTQTAGRRSPFFSRAYGGYTPHQKEFISTLVGSPEGKVIVDPMAGQADFMAQFAWQGAHTLIGDLNPSVLVLARLRDPLLLSNADSLAESVRHDIQKIFRKRTHSTTSRHPLSFNPEWLSEKIVGELLVYSENWQLPRLGSPSSGTSPLWQTDPIRSLVLGLPLLAAREFVSFRLSDNATWFKKGGLLRIPGIKDSLLRALDNWHRYAKAKTTRISNLGTLSAKSFDLTQENGFGADSADFVITSPPYANRLDYSRLWAPELEVLLTLLRAENPLVKERQIGTNVVRGRTEFDLEENKLPDAVRQSLNAIVADRASKASSSYYYPFFRNYALAMRRATLNMASLLRPGGKIVIFVRDTVRKDIVFPSAQLITETLKEAGNMETAIPPEAHIVRKHIGLRRRREGVGLRGLAQQEWWLVLQKRVQ